MRAVSPLVAAAARKLAVDLDAVTATGAGGRVSVGDVRAAAGLERSPRTPAPLARVPVAGPTRGPLARNPLLAAARDREPQQVAAATTRGPAPTLFAGGDLPPFTASGIDPVTLLSVPWQARHALAQAPSTAAAYRIQQSFEGLSPEDAENVAVLDFGYHPSNRLYENRMADWLVDGMSEDQMYAAIGFTEPVGVPRVGYGNRRSIGS